MTFKIRTPDGRFTVCTCAWTLGADAAIPVPANDVPQEEATVLLRQALYRLDASGNFVAAAYVDQALSLL